MVDLCGPAWFESGLQAAYRIRAWISGSKEYELAEVPEGMAVQDPLRIVFRDRTGTLTGYEIQHELERCGCWAEMADPAYVVLILGNASTDSDIDKAIAALSGIGEKYLQSQARRSLPPVRSLSLSQGRISDPVTITRNKFTADEVEAVNIREAEGRKSAEAVIPYPPGIAVLYPGETITADTLSYIDTLRHLGAKCQGVADPTLNTILVLRER
jgi:arginine/lysine/ornithine decarboxylase